jgi:hypothetical protein
VAQESASQEEAAEKLRPEITNVDNLKLFESFSQTCAAMPWQLINYTSISNFIGVSQPTVKKK